MRAVLVKRTVRYAKLATSFLVIAAITTSTHFAYPRIDGQAELA